MNYRSIPIAALVACALLLGGKLAYAVGSGIGDYPLAASGPEFFPDTVNFGLVIFDAGTTLGFVLKNNGPDSVLVMNFVWSDMQEFSVEGASNFWLASGGSVAYLATFSPIVHTANSLHQSTVAFQFKDVNGAIITDSVYLMGQESVTVHLSIAKNYLVYADSDIVISQVLTDSLTDIPNPITTFSENIIYNANILEFVDVRNGANTPATDWTLHKTYTTPGFFQVTGNSSGAALKAPGELLQIVFHVLSQAPTFSTSSFIDSIPVLGSDSSDPRVIADTGALLVLDACVPILSQGVTPTSSIMQISSNPAVQTASISYFISENTDQPPDAEFRVYNAAGSLVRTIVNADASPGWHDFQMNVSNLSDGVYSLEFQAGATRRFQRLLVLH
jgi:Cohesin domain